jgi:ribonuclease Z
MVMDYSKAKKGKKISLVFDTMPNECYFDAIADSDLLVHESSFLEKDAQRACETRHSTAREVGKVAAITHCKKLVLTHISPRYKDNEPFENEARMEFNDVTVAKDLMEMEI